MINFVPNPDRLRVDTEIKLLEKDGTEVIVPIIILVKLDKATEKQQSQLYTIVYNLFNKRFTVNKQPKQPIVVKKPWYKFW